MQGIPDFFSVKTIAFTITALNYPMSYLELFGTLFNLWAVWLTVKRKVLTWPIGLVGVVLFLMMFYQSQLFADTAEQIYYIVTGIWGWIAWSRAPKEEDDGIKGVAFSSTREWIPVAIITGILGIIAGYGVSNLHVWFPQWFTAPASYPYIDAVTTMMSFAAQWLMIRKRSENWIYWILIDLVAIWLYWVKDLKLASLLYAIFTIMAIRGLLDWRAAQATEVAETAGGEAAEKVSESSVSPTLNKDSDR